MREDQIHRILGKSIKGFALGNNIAKKGMIFFHVRFLAGLIGVTEKQECFVGSIGKVIFNGTDMSKLTAVVGKDERENIAEADSVGSKGRFEQMNFFGNLGGCFIFQQKRRHEVTESEVQS